ncbi:MAG: hypothetical protein KIS81_09250 [Maricaulaceae bacterium]|nr:hypothetical protein [Maricaulaceae bacterium]
MTEALFERFQALEAALVTHAGTGGRAAARFAAAAGLRAPDTPQAFATRCLREREALDAALSSWRQPSSRGLRLTFAAALVASGQGAEAFLSTRQALAETRRRRGGRSLSNGGACAALSLAAAGGGPDNAGMFFDILEAIAAPWWRREQVREEAFAAAMAAAGETPDSTTDRLSRAGAAMRAASVTGRAARTAVFDVALAGPDPDRFVRAWTALGVGVRSRKGLASAAGQEGLALLAACHDDGSTAADALVAAHDFIRGLRPRADGLSAGRLTVRLALETTGDGAPEGAARDLAAVMAAQAAAFAAVIAVTTVTTTTAVR